MEKFLLSTLSAVLVLATTGPARAQSLLEHAFRSNAVNFCQVFTPGSADTLRNRVIGVENIGSAPIAVSCAFESHESLVYALPKDLTIHVSNTSSQSVSISCSMLVGHYGEPDAYLVTKSVVVPAIDYRGRSIRFDSADNPDPGATTLGDSLIGVNCTLPPGAGLNETRLTWNEVL